LEWIHDEIHLIVVVVRKLVISIFVAVLENLRELELLV